MGYFKISSLLDEPQVVSSMVAGESELPSSLLDEPQFVSSMVAGESELPSSLRAQVLTLIGEIASKASVKEAEVETAVGSPSTYYSAEPSKPTPKPTRSSPLNPKVTTKWTPTIKSTLPTAIGGNNSVISASSVISTKAVSFLILNAPSGLRSQDATVATTSSTPNVGVVQPTGTLKAAVALAIGVVGIMILL